MPARRRLSPAVLLAVLLAVVLALVLAGCASEPRAPVYESLRECEESHPRPDHYCEPVLSPDDDLWRPTVYYPSRELCESEHGRPCSPARCETECPPYQGGEGWIPSS